MVAAVMTGTVLWLEMDLILKSVLMQFFRVISGLAFSMNLLPMNPE
jgi:hypothetical protein